MRPASRIVAVSLLAALPCLGFRGRPLSELRFDERLNSIVAAVATDGTAYLVVFERERGVIYGQIVAAKGAFGPAFFIASGSGPSVAWSGSEYLVSFVTDAGVFIAHVSRLGGRVDTDKAPLLAERYLGTRLVGGRRNVLLVANPGSGVSPNVIVAVALNGSGQKIGGPAAVSSDGFQPYAVTATNFGFAVVIGGFNETAVVRLNDDATVLGKTVVETYRGYASGESSGVVAITSDGSDAYVAFALIPFGCDVCQPSVTLKTAVVTARGELKVPPKTLASEVVARPLVPRGMVWNGSEPVLLLGNSASPFRGALLKLLDNVSAGDTIAEVPGAIGIAPSALLWNGREYLAIADTSAWLIHDNGDLTEIQIGLIPTEQGGARVSASASQYLAAWYESTATGQWIRATRIDREGNHLDDDLLLPSRVEDIASNGSDWLVVGGQGAVRVSSAGKLLDSEPIAAPGEVVAWSGRSYAIISAIWSAGNLMARMVTVDGRVTSATLIAARQKTSDTDTYYGSPSVAWDGDHFIVSYARIVFRVPGGISPVGSIEATGQIVRLDRGGRVLDIFPLPLDAPALVASDGLRICFVWSKDGKAQAAVAPKEDFFRVPPQSFPIGDGLLPLSLTWDGHDFIVAATAAVGGSNTSVIRIGPQGDVRSVSAPPEDLLSFVSLRSVAASTTMPLLLVFMEWERAYAQVARIAAVTEADLVTRDTLPSPPLFVGAASDGTTLTVSWTPVADVLGYQIDARLADGGFRTVGVAGSNRTLARVSLLNLDVAAVVVRAWNSAGTSEPSPDAQINPRRRAARR